jgi:signal transduction histidine kinase
LAKTLLKPSEESDTLLNKMIFKNSIKSKLFTYLSALISITLIIITITSFVITKHETNEVFDSNLVRTAKLLLSLTKHEVIEHETKDSFIIDLGLADDRQFHRYEYKTHFQIWKAEFLIYNSSVGITVNRPINEGFRNVVINDRKWRSFAIHDKESDVIIEVIERKDVRGELIAEILLTLLFPLLLSFIPILLIIWIVVNKSFVKLVTLSQDIKNTSLQLLKPLEINKNLPTEIRPLVDSLNFLLLKLDESVNNERKFIDYASHELQTPLTVIKTKTQFLIRKHLNDKELIGDLGNLLDAVNRVIGLSNQLLVLSRIDTEDRIVSKENFNLSFLVNEVAINFYTTSQNKGINIIATIQDSCTIFANKYHVEILLNNLFDNAIKYSPNNTDIAINLVAKKSQISFTIINKGALIAKEDQKQIFERFYRTQDNNKKGSGLGLSIVKRITNLHNGEIKLTSNNKGNSFILNLPKAPDTK